MSAVEVGLAVAGVLLLTAFYVLGVERARRRPGYARRPSDRRRGRHAHHATAGRTSSPTSHRVQHAAPAGAEFNAFPGTWPGIAELVRGSAAYSPDADPWAGTRAKDD